MREMEETNLNWDLGKPDAWISAKIECSICTYQYWTTYYARCITIECPNCGNMSVPIIIEQ